MLAILSMHLISHPLDDQLAFFVNFIVLFIHYLSALLTDPLESCLSHTRQCWLQHEDAP